MIREPSIYEMMFCPTGECAVNELETVEENIDPRKANLKMVERENIIKLGDPLFQRVD